MKHTMKLKLYSLVIFLMFTAASVSAFPIPDTGITKCYDDTKEIPCPSEGQDFYGQDGNYSINPMSYTKLDANGNDLPITATEWAMVRDNVTGLIWENKNSVDKIQDYTNPHDADNTYTWYDSNPATNGGNAGTAGDGTDTEDFIKTLNDSNFGGYSDWRLPTIAELGSIVDFSIPYPGPTINTSYFNNTINSDYWSRSKNADSASDAWTVNFTIGYEISSYSLNDNNVRAVRGGQSDIGSFDNLVIKGDGTITDSATDLMWQQDTAKTITGAATMVWKDALSYCENLTLGGYTDWRLPSIKELRSIVDLTHYNPAINTRMFKDTFASFYWSRTKNSYGGYAWGVYFDDGMVYVYGNRYKDSYVRCVRGGQSSVIEPSYDYSKKILYDDFSVSQFNNNNQWQVEESGGKIENWNAVQTNGRLSVSLTNNSAGRSYLNFKLKNDIKLKKSMSATIRLLSADARSGVRICGHLLNVKKAPPYLYSNDGNVWVGIYIENMTGMGYRVAMTATVDDSDENVEQELIPWQTVTKDIQLNTDYQASVSFDEPTRTITLEFNGIKKQYTFDDSFQLYKLSSCYSNGLKIDAYIGDSSDSVDENGITKNLIAEIDDVWVSEYNDPPLEQCPTVDLNSINISPTTAALTQPDEEIHFLVKGYLSSGEITTPENIKWETSDSDVASTENGKIVAVGEGTATITASVSTSAGTLTAQAEVTVSFTPAAIEVSPALLFLEKGKSAEPVVSVLYSDGRRKTLTDSSEYSLSATTGTDNVQINGKKITAIADGISDIEVKAKSGSSELSASLRVYVTAPVPLNITPASIRVKQSQLVTIEIDGGTPPYSVSLVSPSSSSLPDNAGTVEQVSGQYIWTVTASSKGGEYSYSISDSTGQKAVLTMTVLASLTIEYQTQKSGKTLDSVSQSYSGSQRADLKEFALKAAGGTPPFKWFSTSGEITSNPSDSSQITYIPPSAPGIYTVTVVDSGGQSQDFKVSTIVQLNTIPEKIYPAQNESSDIAIFGGVSPFTVNADAGVAGKISYYPGVGVFSYTAPAVSGGYMLTVKDSAGNTVRVYADVSPKLTVSPSKVYLRRNQTQTFQIAGGVGSDEDIYITTLQGEANNHPENMKFIYNSLGASGSDIITITDLSGAQAKVEIEIINSDTTGDFFITPSTATLLKKEGRLFKSVGGIGQEIVWKAEHGTISGQKQPSIKYTAPDIKSDTTTTSDTANTTANTTPANHLNTQLYATDLNTREASAGIYVIADKVLISPSQVFLKPGEHADFQGHFGTEEYKFTWTKGDGSVDETSGILTYTAPSEVGTYYITVFDSSGNSSKAEIVVRGGAKRTKIKKTDIFEITNPSPTPNSETQPVGVGNVQKGGKSFSLAFDFPNYKDGKGEPLPMNFYAAAFISDMNLWVLFDEHGNIFDLNNITACMSNMTNAVYTESLKFDYCNPDSPLKVDMYVLAIESEYDPNKNLNFQPADAPFELWHYSFSFPKCQ